MKKLLDNQISSNGFMLVETMIALAVLSVMSVSILNLQDNIMNKMWQAAEGFRHFLQLQNQFAEPKKQEILTLQQNSERQVIQTNQRNFLELRYALEPVNSKSELYRHFSDIYVLKSSGIWQGLHDPIDKQLVTLRHVLPKIEN